nr:MAG TPA: hypothetical protein [Caudoviricetes sp.]
MHVCAFMFLCFYGCKIKKLNLNHQTNLKYLMLLCVNIFIY